LVDPATLSTDPAKHFTLNYYVPSWNGAYVVYGTSEGGSETLNAVAHVIETDTGKVLPDALLHAGFGVTGWMLDDKSFLYLRLPTLAPGESPMDAEQKIVTMQHVLGTDQSADVPVIGYGVSPNLTFAPSDVVDPVVTPVSPWMLAIVQHGVQNEQTIYAAPLAAYNGVQTPWKKILDVADGVEGEDLRGNTLYVRTHTGAPRFQVVAYTLSNEPSATGYVTKRSTVVAPSADVVENVSVAADGLYVLSRLGGFGRIRRFTTADDGAISGPPAEVTLPYRDGTINTIVTDPRVPGTTFDETGWLETELYYRSDANLAVTKTDLKPPSPVDVSKYTSEEVEAPAADGTMIPLSIVRAKAFTADGSHPTYLEGYGAYGITITPGFNPTHLAWLEHNGVYAVCHVRGGGWYGEDWHAAGMLATKVNTITDFIACGRWLVAHKYTSPAHLAGEGTSAGGILIGGAITHAPNLFAAALDVVGMSNALRSEFSPNGPANIPEFGSVTTPAGFKALEAMDAIQHVKSGVAYPAVMLCTGINDRRVPRGNSASSLRRCARRRRAAVRFSCGWTTTRATGSSVRRACRAKRCWLISTRFCSGNSATPRSNSCRSGSGRADSLGVLLVGARGGIEGRRVARVRVVEGAAQVRDRLIEVDLRRLDARMAEQFLQRRHVAAAFDEVGCERVAHRVRRRAVDAALRGVVLYDLPHLAQTEARVAVAQEERAVARGGALMQVRLHRVDGGLGERHHAPFVALAGDHGELLGEIDVVEIESGEFGAAQPAAVEQLDDRAIARGEVRCVRPLDPRRDHRGDLAQA
jgi:prolyl oligopeptidase